MRPSTTSDQGVDQEFTGARSPTPEDGARVLHDEPRTVAPTRDRP
jgi:hypothetical protein